jgi:hypothetical protein
LGAIDSLGRAEIFQVLKKETEKKKQKIEENLFSSYSLEKPSKLYGGHGFSGISFNQNNEEKVVTSRLFYKDIYLYQNEKVLRKFNLGQYPYQLKYITIENNNFPLIGVNEYNNFCIYDDRVNEKNGKILSFSTVIYF